jgi:hypothetical protein
MSDEINKVGKTTLHNSNIQVKEEKPKIFGFQIQSGKFRILNKI